MLPLRDKVKSNTFPIIVYAIIVLNVIVFIYQLSMDNMKLLEFFYYYGVVPAFLGGDEYWEIRGAFSQLFPFISSMFLHGGWMHIIGNMWTLFIFGDNVQDRMGRGKFVVFYILSGIASMLLHTFTNWGSTTPAIGASGAIAGVMGAYLVYFPRAKIVTLLPLIFYFTIITVPAYVFLIIWFGMQFFNGTFALLSSGGGGGIAWWAHVGGFAFGALTAKLFQKGDPPMVDINLVAEKFH